MELSSDIQIQLKNIFAKMPIEAAYIFGSSVNGSKGKESDIDIAVLFSEGGDKNSRFEMRLELIGKFSRLFKKEIDLVVLNDLTSLFFIYVIITEGKPIYEKSEGARLDFESRTLGCYFDFEPFFSLYNRQYVQNSL